MKEAIMVNKYMNGKERIDQILNESCRLFAEKSYDSVSVREIADSCGCSPALIMKNFRSKEEIYSALLNEWTKQCEEPLIKDIPDGDPIIALEKIYILLIFEKDQRKCTFRPNLENAIESRISYQSVFADIKRNTQDITTEIILPLILRGQKDGNIKKADPKVLADAIWFIIYGSKLLTESFSAFETVRFEVIKELLL